MLSAVLTLGVQRQRGDSVLLLGDVGHRGVAEAGQVPGGGGSRGGAARRLPQVPKLHNAVHACWWEGREQWKQGVGGRVRERISLSMSAAPSPHIHPPLIMRGAHATASSQPPPSPPPVASWLLAPCRKVREVTEGRVRPCSGVRRRFCRSFSAWASCKAGRRRWMGAG